MAVAAMPPPADAVQARAVRFYRPELDVLRLFAFGLVWLAHAILSFSAFVPPWLSAALGGAGSCGVPVFFFLSAYLITELLRREQIATGTVHLRSFYIRRILRIWPLYFGVLALYGVLGLRFHGFRIEPGRLLLSVLLAGNWYIALHPAITTPMRALWSISVEEQWYVLWPLLRRSFPARFLILVCALTVGFAHLLLFIVAQFGDPRWLHVTAWVNSGVQFQYFALGAAAALLLQGRVPVLRRPQRFTMLFAGLAAFTAAGDVCRIKEAGALHTPLSLSAGYALAGLGTAAVFFAFLGIPGRFCPRALVRLGQLSFGLYVFHETGFFLANALTRAAGIQATLPALAAEKIGALLLTVVLAFVSWHAWELPFLRWKQRWTLVRSREAA